MHTQFERWLRKYAKVIPKTEAKYLCRTCILLDKDGKINFPQLYLLAKIHKDPFSTHPIVSVSGSPLHGLARWADWQLQPLAQSIPSYIKSLFEFVKKIQLQQATMPFPTTALLFTCDAVAMYTNINTTKALEELQPRTQEHVLKALEIIMRRNSFQFSDTYWHQKQGTAMGTPPACMWATLFFTSHEQHLNEQYNEFLLHWSRYIDDGFGVWNWTSTPECITAFENFKREINATSLTWEVSSPKTIVNFLDLTLTIRKGIIKSTLFEKALNLHLYIPPSSAHPPGILKELIAGSLLQIIWLTSN